MKTKRLPNGRGWERTLARQQGRDAAVIFLARVQARYDELLSQAQRHKKKALRIHFEENLRLWWPRTRSC